MGKQSWAIWVWLLGGVMIGGCDDAAQGVAEVIDAARDMAIELDASPDMALPDMARPDMRLPDAAIPDMQAPDAAAPDMLLPDAANPDMLLPDAAPPRDAGLKEDAAPDASPPDMGPECGADDDCADGEFCADGRCLDGCRNHGGCRMDELCLNNGCEDNPACGDVEICGNNLDDDCDGQLDDEDECGGGCEPALPCETRLPGVCAPGHTTCPGGRFGETDCVSDIEAVAELCDGFDNDCDGLVDEDIPGLREGCEVGVGICVQFGVNVCDAEGAVTCNRTPSDPLPEACTGFDEDCDGTTDEGFPVGEVCIVGLGACRTEGTFVCDLLGAATCNAPELAGRDELCDGIDNDCDGRIDEAFPSKDQPCTEGVGGCAAQGVGVCTADLTGTVCTATAGVPEGEDCDGVDDDCDGNTDEGDDGQPLAQDCYEGPEGTLGVVPCQGGRRTCVDGAFGACDGQVIPEEEVCDDVDNDCDGIWDERNNPDGSGTGRVLTEGCFDADPGLVNVGACREGSRLCRFGAFGACRDPILPRAEICDNVDNDCDGTIDEQPQGQVCTCEAGEVRDCYAAAVDTVDVGPCRSGRQTCSAEGEFGFCEGEILPRFEICNGVDDDCNGRVDDGIVGLGQPCTEGRGECAQAGTIVCDAGEGALGCSVVAGVPGVERCDGLDNDCDGRVDEDFRLGIFCSVGQGSCYREGVRTCGADGDFSCSVEAGAPQPELCNVADDDCDGNIDEELNLGADCTLGLGPCEAAGRVICGPGGTTTCSATPALPQREICDTIDNDCDGAADEDWELGVACLSGRGLCARQGISRCIDGVGQCDAVPAAGDPELCDAQDNDCDGRVDEGNPGGGAGCQTGANGVCDQGVNSCVQGQVLCVQALQPTPDICDGADNDCDGLVDEAGQGQSLCGLGVCQHLIDQCDGGQGGQCNPLLGALPEVCDGVDNDCDGLVDETPIDAGGVCSAGSGACSREGSIRCVDGALQCDAVASEAREEICDGRDNDCDGTTDEQPSDVGGACDRGVGACRDVGETVCNNGFVVCTAVAADSSPELCDLVDNDCDGRVDENPSDVGLGCSGGVGICARFGFTVCVGGAVGCDAVPGAPGADETCNGLDDDCDGQLDEQVVEGGAACTGGLGTCQRDGIMGCVDARMVCEFVAGEPAAELCDTLDNDCDGLVDENPTVDGGAACNTGVGECARAGQMRCAAAGQLVCDAVAAPTSPEICDGLDNDCDGTIDENPGGLGDPCVGGEGVCQRPGTTICAAGAIACNAVAGAPEADELCDGLDNDCDGTVDEQPTDVGAACQSGEGQCVRDGVTVCVNGAAACNAPAGGVEPEVCDGFDNDCDGRFDEAAAGVGVLCTGGLGVCARPGFNVCVDGQLACDAQPGLPGLETCDGRDEDCDGTVDEQALGLGGPCLGGEGICQAPGTTICAAGALGCDAPLGQPQPEVCNNTDDDCDGTIDEQPTDIGVDCVDGIGECFAAGQTACANGEIICGATRGEATPELCDNLDNDCDGTVDELATDVGGPCLNGVGTCSNGGTTICVGGQEVCGAVPNPPDPEICDNLDNDCDGTIDEQLVDVDQTCVSGVGVCLRNGLTFCQDHVLLCTAQAGPPVGEEICNFLDEDCDGELDEGFDVGTACIVGAGGCRREGVMACVGGGSACTALTIPPEPVDFCGNDLDDDCDGLVDEGCAGGGIGLMSGSSTFVLPAGGGFEHAAAPAREGEPEGALMWSLDAAPLGMSVDAQTGAVRWKTTPDDIGLHRVRLRIESASEARGRPMALVVFGEADSVPPTAWISGPESGQLLTGWVDVVGTVDDETLAFWRLELAGSETSQPRWLTVAEGDEAVQDAVLGQLDAARIEGGAYVLRITAWDLGGNATERQISVRIAE